VGTTNPYFFGACDELVFLVEVDVIFVEDDVFSDEDDDVVFAENDDGFVEEDVLVEEVDVFLVEELDVFAKDVDVFPAVAVVDTLSTAPTLNVVDTDKVDELLTLFDELDDDKR
jgi:hypothetical protein